MGASATGDKNAVYRALLNDAAAKWAEAGCGVHAISLLAHDRPSRSWFWNGFGLTVVDAIRAIQPLEFPPPPGIDIRKATADDIPAITRLEMDHAQYYPEPPILMAAYDPNTPTRSQRSSAGRIKPSGWRWTPTRNRHDAL